MESKVITLRQMASGQWRALYEPNSYSPGAGLHTTKKLADRVYEAPKIGWGETPQEALNKLLGEEEMVFLSTTEADAGKTYLSN